MPYVTSIELLAKEEGREEGRKEGREEARAIALQGTALALEMKFGPGGAELLPALEKARDLEMFQTVHDAIRRGATLEELREMLG